MDDLKLYAKNEKGLELLVQTVRIFSDDIGTEFGIDKCAALVPKRGGIQSSMEFHCLMEDSLMD